jgi:hypothetical protein
MMATTPSAPSAVIAVSHGCVITTAAVFRIKGGGGGLQPNPESALPTGVLTHGHICEIMPDLVVLLMLLIKAL